jgi:uncharacterized protein (DUF736 family)
MAEYDNTNRGALFKNKRKTKPNHPDLTGRINIKGVDHWFSGWTKTSQGGDKYISINIGEPCDQQAQSKPLTESAQNGFDQFCDDIPF